MIGNFDKMRYLESRYIMDIPMLSLTNMLISKHLTLTYRLYYFLLFTMHDVPGFLQ